MRRTLLLLSIVAIVAVPACGDDADETTTTSAPATTAAPTGEARVEVCTDALNDAWADVARTEDRIAAMAEQLDSEPLVTVCDFFFATEFPADLGLSVEETIMLVESQVDAELFTFLTEPVEPMTFDEVGDGL